MLRKWNDCNVLREAPRGFEPRKKSFAGSPLNHSGTAPMIVWKSKAVEESQKGTRKVAKENEKLV
jgi:hypothetical protein